MAENIKVLNRRIRTVANIKQVTRAMEMVSAAKLRRAQSRLMAGRPYTSKIQQLLARLAGTPGTRENRLFEERTTSGRTLVVLYTADRGLCGSFNVRLNEKAQKFIDERGRDNTALYCVGKKGRDYFRRRGYTIHREVLDLSGNLNAERTSEIGNELVDLFLKGEFDEVYIVYAEFVSTMVSEPRVVKFLPLDPESLAGGEEEEESESTYQKEYIFEPNAKAVFDGLLPAYLRSRIFILLAENFTSEHSARMIAMSNATKNCEEMGQSLTLRRNKARQTAITTEMMEIVGGAEALSGA